MIAVDSYQDMIDVRDIIAVLDESAYVNEIESAQALLDELRGNGGAEQYQGDWYPSTLIRDSYFKDYAMQLAEDIGAINDDNTWPAYCIDWERAARELQMDYTSVEFNGVTYWYR